MVAEGGTEDAAGPVELPAGAELQSEIQEDEAGGVAAVQAEFDNYLMEAAEAECGKDRGEYCDPGREVDYAGPQHTMCKHCGVGPACPVNIDRLVV